ncbi:MAG TPA: T9SS type A sorting domain-containing protein [Paludibacteraceae bacterium]|nr:T9SS type A sorting domain-containing protein [Paludibacteraceae bacterium]
MDYLSKKVVMTSVCSLLFVLFAFNAKGEEFAGQTTAGTYEISSAETLQLLKDFVNGTGSVAPYNAKHQCGGYTFMQTADIDLTGQSFAPIGNSGYRFKGTYDGGNYKITGLSIGASGSPVSADGVGLFGYVDTGGALKNIVLEGGSVYANNIAGSLTGGINTGTIDNCHSSCMVNGLGNVGGLIGKIEGNTTVSNCSSSGEVQPQSTSSNALGGLIGTYSGSGAAPKVYNCYSTSNVSAKYQVGGFIGNCSGSGIIENCYATGNITITAENKGGGFIGDLSGTVVVKTCYATGNVIASTAGRNLLGGFAGDIRESNNVQNCYARGDVNGNQNIGGFAGHIARATVQNCYATGAVTGVDNVGGLVGYLEENNSTSAIKNSVALNPSITRGSGTNNTFGAAIGKTTVTDATRYSVNYSFNEMALPSGTLTGLACNQISKEDINLARNWWDISSSTGYYATIGTVNPPDVWIFADHKLPILKNGFFVNQSDAMPAHLLMSSDQVIQPASGQQNIFKISNGHLMIDENVEVTALRIYNVEGKVVLSDVSTARVIDISHIQSGVYIVKAITNKGTKVAKIVK